MMRFRLSRRELLKTFGLTAASVPLLDALAPARAQAQTMPRRRLVSIVVEHGVFPENWLPYVPSPVPVATTSPGNFLQPPSAYLQKVAFEQRAECRAISLAPYGGALAPVLSAKWQAVKSRCAFIRGLGSSNAVVQGHTNTAMLGGFQNALSNDPDPNLRVSVTGESIDVVVARKLTGRLPLCLRAPNGLDDVRQLETTFLCSSFRRNAGGAFEYVSAFRDPLRVWDRLFADFDPGTTPTRPPGERRAALLQRTVARLERLRADARLSGYDRTRLENHQSLLEQQVAALGTMTPPPPSTATPPPRPALGSITTQAAFDAVKGGLFKAQLRNAAGAVKLNKEQVVTVNCGLEDAWLSDGLALGGDQAYHASAGHLASPSTAILDEVRRVQLFVFDALADFIAELNTVEDPATGATYLDNTLVMITFEHDGVPNGHLRQSVPSILAGGFGTFTGGTLLDYAVPAKAEADSYANYRGLSYARLLYSVLGAFGVTAAERANLDLQGVAHDWAGCELTGWNQPLTGLSA